MKKGTGLLLALLPVVAAAEPKTWVAVLDPEGTATSANANVAENWDPVGIPTSEDDIVLDGERSNVPMVWTVAATGDSAPTTVNSWTQKASYTSRVTMSMTRTGAFTQLFVSGDAVLEGGEWIRSGQTKDDKNNTIVWLNVKVGGDLTVGTGFVFDAYNAGFYKQKGPSSAGDPVGAAHGGLGGGNFGNGTAYGDYRTPTSLGSGAYGTGQDYYGGGCVVLTVSGVMKLDGTVTADGGDGTDCGGASGGSVWITAKRLSGSGTITAEGGSTGVSSKRYGGGGGRISIQLTDVDFAYEDFNALFAGTLQARGGYTGKNDKIVRVSGGAGTIYIETAADQGKGHMILGNGNWPGGKGTTNFNADTPINNGVTWDLSSLDMKVNGHVGILEGGTLKLPSFSVITGDASDYARLHLRGGVLQSEIKHDKLVLEGFGLMVSGTNSVANYHVVVPSTAKVVANADSYLVVGSLKLNGTKLAAGEYVASSLNETYPNVSGEGTIKVLGLADGLMLIVR